MGKSRIPNPHRLRFARDRHQQHIKFRSASRCRKLYSYFIIFHYAGIAGNGDYNYSGRHSVSRGADTVAASETLRDQQERARTWKSVATRMARMENGAMFRQLTSGGRRIFAVSTSAG